jgi:hypothetical protein
MAVTSRRAAVAASARMRDSIKKKGERFEALALFLVVPER